MISMAIRWLLEQQGQAVFMAKALCSVEAVGPLVL